VDRIDDRSGLKDRDRQSGLDRADRSEIGVPLPIGRPFVLPMLLACWASGPSSLLLLHLAASLLFASSSGRRP
jgi:hypothetical protein